MINSRTKCDKCGSETYTWEKVDEGQGFTCICIGCGKVIELDGKGEILISTTYRDVGDEQHAVPGKGHPYKDVEIYWQPYTGQRGRGQWVTSPYVAKYDVRVHYRPLRFDRCRIIVGFIRPCMPEDVYEHRGYHYLKQSVYKAFSQVCGFSEVSGADWDII